MGKKKGARVIAIAGGQEKCKWLKETLGVDEALDYKSPTFYKDFKKASFFGASCALPNVDVKARVPGRLF
jgi:NADPH-dependent curcumin reductase CurA